jgi:hypothetical protein
VQIVGWGMLIAFLGSIFKENLVLFWGKSVQS